MEDKKERAWKCRHCIFLKKDANHGNMRVCFLGGRITWMDPNNIACKNFSVTKRAKAVGKYLDRVDAGLVGKKKRKKQETVTAKEMLERLKEHVVKKTPEEKPRINLPIVPVGCTPVPKEQRTSAFKQQMCAGRCCKRKEICNHYVSWIEHGKPKDSVKKMIRSVSDCINDVHTNWSSKQFSKFSPIKGMSEDDVKEYQDTVTF